MTDVQASERTNLARMMNFAAIKSNPPLEPLYGMNHQIIPNFPKTGRALGGLTAKFLGHY